jgi:hypothetical protein
MGVLFSGGADTLLENVCAGKFARVVDTVHYEVCHIFVVLGNVLRGLIMDSMEIIFSPFGGMDLALTALKTSFASSRVNKSMYSSSKWGIGYLNSPLVDVGVGGGRVADEDSCTGEAGGLGIPLSFLAIGGRVFLPDGGVSPTAARRSVIFITFCELVGRLASAALGW